MNEIWIVGATGRTGRMLAAELAAREAGLVLVGRDAARLRELADNVDGQPRTVVAASSEAIATELARATPAVVINLVGPFTETAEPIIRACPHGCHYVDLANELFAVTGLLGMHDEAVATGRTLVTGAGFGVLAAESVVFELCRDRPAPARVRVDTLAAIDSEPGLVGSALAGTLVESLAVGGRRYERGKLVRTRLGADPERYTLPDGSTACTAAVPTGDLDAAYRASAAPAVVAASGAVPTSRAARALLPAAAALLARPRLADAAKRRLARVHVRARPRTREFSWARGRVVDTDGCSRQAWLRAGEAMAFTVATAAEVATRLARGEGQPGAYTPGALFGPELAEQAGGRFVLEATAT